MADQYPAVLRRMLSGMTRLQLGRLATSLELEPETRAEVWHQLNTRFPAEDCGDDNDPDLEVED